MPPRRAMDVLPWVERPAQGRRANGSGRSGLHADAPPDQALACADVRKDEDELERLIAEVREGRERLSDLIETIKSERAGWDEREQRWERWRSQLRNPPRKSSRRDVH
jgi:hypothetical protein